MRSLSCATANAVRGNDCATKPRTAQTGQKPCSCWATPVPFGSSSDGDTGANLDIDAEVDPETDADADAESIAGADADSDVVTLFAEVVAPISSNELVPATKCAWPARCTDNSKPCASIVAINHEISQRLNNALRMDLTHA